MLKGIGASQGISIGNVYKMTKEDFVIPFYSVLDTSDEINRFENALKQSSEALMQLKQHIEKTIDHAHSMIFDAHIHMVNDIEVINQVKHRIETECINAEYIYYETMNMYIDLLTSNQDEYFRGRAADLIDVKQRVLSTLLKQSFRPLNPIDENVILCAEDIMPSDIVTFDQSRIQGIVTELGGKTSHSVIIAKSLGIPVVVGVSSLLKSVNQGQQVIVDGNEGSIIINPSTDEIKRFEDKKVLIEQHEKRLETYKLSETTTKDLIPFKLSANIGVLEDLTLATTNGAKGVGLYRTEYLLLNKDSIPNEEQQYEAYVKVLKAFSGEPVIMRTFDVGGDKIVNGVSKSVESNPFLGLRGIRLSFARTNLFKTQLKALLRASIHGQLHMMFPMVTTLEDIKEAKAIVLEIQKELDLIHVDYQHDVKIGIMIEVPSTAILASQFAKEVDFFSIGTNDLTQYVMASDRTNASVSNYYQPLHPAVLNLIKMVVDAAHHEGIWVSVCGEIASDSRAIPILIGLGVDTLSLHPSDLLKAKEVISKYTIHEMKENAMKTINMSTEKDVINYMKETIQ